MRTLFNVAVIVISIVTTIRGVYSGVRLAGQRLREVYPARYVRSIGWGALWGAIAAVIATLGFFLTHSTPVDARNLGLLLLGLVILVSQALGGGLVGALGGMIVGRARRWNQDDGSRPLQNTRVGRPGARP